MGPGVIVVDTNVLVHALAEGPQSALAHRLREADPDWRAPELLLHEFLNVLATFVRTGTAKPSQAETLWEAGVGLMAHATISVDLRTALRLAMSHGISGYDAQFIALAQKLGAVLVTEDRRLRKAFPSITTSMEEFCA